MDSSDNAFPKLPGDHRAIFEAYSSHNAGKLVHTENTVTAVLLEEYPSYDVTSTTCNLTNFAKAGRAVATIAEDVHPTLRTIGFKAGSRFNADGTPSGTLQDSVTFARYNYDWHGHRFLVFEIDGQNGTMGRCDDRRWYVLSHFDGESGRNTAHAHVEELLLAVGIWGEENHDEVWVFDHGQWTKDKALWKVVQGSKWEDLVLDEGTKSSIMRDVVGFFDAKHLYNDLGTPWKVSYRVTWSSDHCCFGYTLINHVFSEDCCFMVHREMERLQLRKR